MHREIESRNKKAFFNYLLGLGDDLLILGHRLSEWCGHGPILEEDIALSNIALDCTGGASALLQLAGKTEGKGRTDDDLAYFREAVEFRNFQLLELPKGDFAFTIARQFLFDNYSYFIYGELLKSSNTELASISAKIFKEVNYHLRHSGEWVLRLGDGTSESHSRIQRAFNDLWMYTGELFLMDDECKLLLENAVVPDLEKIKPRWQQRIFEALSNATVALPEIDQYYVKGSRQGFHTEHLGHLLAEMQIVARSFPGAKW